MTKERKRFENMWFKNIFKPEVLGIWKMNILLMLKHNMNKKKNKNIYIKI